MRNLKDIDHLKLLEVFVPVTCEKCWLPVEYTDKQDSTLGYCLEHAREELKILTKDQD